MPQKHRWFRRAFFFAVSLYPAVLAADPSNAVVDPPEAASNTFSARTLQLDPVVVTANRLDTPADRVSSSMSVVTAGDLARTQARTALDALQTVPGISLTRTGGPGGIASLYTRGGNDDATLVMLDGIPLNDPVGTSRSYNYLDQLSLDGIRQVEVVRGPQGALYGSAAMAGVVNLLTGDGQGPLGGSLRFEGGSYG
ncbi:MAG TPA: TonB-dependent receptor plug domain-containing protein, partial [bacterium]|nr:TonB-dependent receptor plug domain-containing protein [bacterium]